MTPTHLLLMNESNTCWSLWTRNEEGETEELGHWTSLKQAEKEATTASETMNLPLTRKGC